MKTTELQLDAQTLERAWRLAESRRCAVEQLLTDLLEQPQVPEGTHDPFLGMAAQEPELLDRVLEGVMRARAAPVRREVGG